ncbi:MAG: hypothetical protein AAGG75_02015 [Bacteroidota bacterium]
MYKHLLLTLLLCSFVGYHSYGQIDSDGKLPYTTLPYQIKWSLQTELLKTDGLNACAEAANGDIIGVGSISINKKNTDALITLLSPEQRQRGQAPRSIILGGPNHETVFEVCTTTDGGYLVVGQTQGGQDARHPFRKEGYAWLFKLNAQGELQWQRLMANEGSARLVGLIALPQGHYLAVGERSDSLWLYRFQQDNRFVAEYLQGSSTQRYSLRAATRQGNWIGICGSQQSRRAAQPFFLALPLDQVFEPGYAAPRTLSLDQQGEAVGITGTGDRRFLIVGNQYGEQDQDIVVWEVDRAKGKRKKVLSYRGWGQDTAMDIIRSKQGDYFIVGYTHSFPRDASFQDNPLFFRLTPDYQLAEWLFDYQRYDLRGQQGVLRKLALTSNEDLLLAGAMGNRGKRKEDGWLLRVGLPEAARIPVPVLAFVYGDQPVVLSPVEREVPLELRANVHNFGDTTAYDVQVRLNPPYMVEPIGREVLPIDSIPPGQTRSVVFKYQIGPFFAPEECTLYTVLWEDQYNNHDAIAHLKRILPYTAYRPSPEEDYYIPEDSPDWLDIPHGPNAGDYNCPSSSSYLIEWAGYSKDTKDSLASGYKIYDDYIVLRAKVAVSRPLDTSHFKIDIKLDGYHSNYQQLATKVQSAVISSDDSHIYICKIRLKEGLNTIQLYLDTGWKSSPIHIQYEPPPVHFVQLSIPYENIDSALYARIETLKDFLEEQTDTQKLDRIYSDLHPIILKDSCDTHKEALEFYFASISQDPEWFEIENYHRIIFLSFSHGITIAEANHHFYIYPAEFKDEKNVYNNHMDTSNMVNNHVDTSNMVNFEKNILVHLIASNCRKLIALVDACQSDAITEQMDGEIKAIPCIEDITASDTIKSAVPNQLYIMASTRGSAWAVKEDGTQKATHSHFIEALICAFTGECLEQLNNYPYAQEDMALNNDRVLSINEMFRICREILEKQEPAQNPVLSSKNMDGTAVSTRQY